MLLSLCDIGKGPAMLLSMAGLVSMYPVSAC